MVLSLQFLRYRMKRIVHEHFHCREKQKKEEIMHAVMHLFVPSLALGRKIKL